MAIFEEQLFVLGEQTGQVRPVSKTITRHAVGYVTGDRVTRQPVTAEVIEVQWAIVASPGLVHFAEAPAMQVPITGVVARAFFHQQVLKKKRSEIDEFLIDEVAIQHVHHTVLQQLWLPPIQKRCSVGARVDADETQIELSRSQDISIVRQQVIVGIILIEMRRQHDVVCPSFQRDGPVAG